MVNWKAGRPEKIHQNASWREKKKEFLKTPKFPTINILKSIFLKNVQFKQQITTEIIRHLELNSENSSNLSH